ncbi:ComEC/Rec2 family competence protein [Rhodoflexus caldus]|uniref:ComEC/Rec2 family competence protein n=1 Tax=Rhodoflexus caldus TaxID=2891236 RepID=UPI00202AADB2|nr:ComEC/Rec2 family competence protein [Rhodoflexus caldus]
MVFKSNWESLPFLRVALLVIAGIICARYMPAGIWYAGTFATAVIAYLWCYRLVMRRARAANLFYIGATVSVYIAFFSFGALRMWQVEPRERMSLHVPDSLVKAYEADIISPVKPNTKGNSNLTVQLVRVKTDSGWLPANAKVQLSVQADSANAVLSGYGNRLLIIGAPQPIEPPKNPDGFDYRQLMRNKGIAYQHFVKAGQWQLLPYEPPFSLRGLALRIQKWADHTLEQAMNSPMEAGLASALIIGLKDELDETLLRAYAATGIMHVLAVSGLHVGILFTILSFVLKPLQNHPQGKYAFAGIVLLVLWSYALITGLSPSVMRAALMFSLLNVGQLLFGRRNSSFNTLALSAVILLAYDPLMLFQVGFQLSYAAVAGIMYFYPRFYRLWESRYWLTDRIWQITCVSVAAQLATFPLGIYYFHQFPNYFLLSNLFAIPLAFFILSGGLAVLAFSWNNFLAELLGWMLKWLAWLNNYLAFMVESLPFSATQTLYINQAELMAIYGAIISITVFFVVRKQFWLAAAFTCALVISIATLMQRQENERLLAVFHTARHSSVLWIGQGQSLLQADSSLLAQPQQIRYAFADFLLKRGINWENMPVATLGNADTLVAMRRLSGGFLYRKNGITVFYLRQRVRKLPMPPCDVLLIANNALRSLQTISKEQLHKIRHVVLDGSNSIRTARQLKREAAELGVPCHAVSLDGAFLWQY